MWGKPPPPDWLPDISLKLPILTDMEREQRTALPFPLAVLALLPKELTLSKDANQRFTWEVIPRGIGGPGGRERGGK